MQRFEGRDDYRHDEVPGLGILITNLGTPDEPTAPALRRYLGEFLWDRRVVEVPRPLWWLILNGVVLRTRPAKSAEAYARVWTDRGSPLLYHCEDIVENLEKKLKQRFRGKVTLALGMRYGKPSLESALESLRDRGVRRLLVLPLYPQYASSTTGSTFEKITGILSQWRWMPEFRMVTSYHDDVGYVQALANSIREHWYRNGRGERLMFSFHGIPRFTFLAGDPYHCHCHKTARLVAEKLGLSDDEWHVCFQSRFGKAEWLKPYTDETLEHWGREGVGDIDVACPGFPADCLETLDEIAYENAELFESHGGGKLRYIPALNSSEDHLHMLQELVTRHAAGWPELNRISDDQAEADAQKSLGLARRLGAKQ
ncbi:ferrochelatase [Natronospira proteinivora]|uniref:Ferrochelatase n=1 Tax=Natronospira proteinivora TaxID=1807133 RepID=A0ABT1GA69_9GAMM|nr:ferrochelatase [Natronospira proteinivora]MCP1728161.1 ferrochelatase [Natronospira proteinivora]